MRLVITLLTVLFFGLQANAQTIKGQVRSKDGNFLVNSTIMLLDTKDSSMLSFGKSKEEGLFELRGITKDEAILQVTHVGFEKYFLYLNITGKDQNLGIITLDEASKELEEFVVKGEKASIAINKDTVEFNAGSFKVQENAVAEDLLKRLPGVEVDRDGSITSQGKSVPRILVNGKEFFGKDPKMATKNIPADAIDKVQVFEKKSDRAEFTGIDDGEEETTINFILRKDKSNLGFGRFVAGLGADKDGILRYNANAMYNTFKNNNQISLTGNLNNINQQSFSTNQFSMGGGRGFNMGGGGAGGGSGLMRNLSAGANFNSVLSKKSEINGSYSYTNTNTFRTQDSRSESVVGDLNTAGKGSSVTDSDNEMHRLNFTLNHKINPKNSIRWINRFDYRNTASVSNNQNEEAILSTGQLRNSTDRVNTSDGNSLGITSQALYQKSFDKKGRSLTANLTLGVNNSLTDGLLVSRNGVFNAQSGGLTFTNLNQISNQDSKNFNIGADVSYTEPINRNNFLEFNYAFQKRNNDLNKEVYDVAGESKTFNSQLSNIYENDYTYNRGGISYRASYEKWNGNIGASIQESKLNGNLILRNEVIKKTFVNPVFNGRVRYSFTNSKTMDLTYATNISEPSMTQLSPVPDNSNPLRVVIGNPDLKPQYAQRLNLNFRNFNQLKFTNFFVTAGLNYTDDKITNKIIYDEVTLAQTVTPVNFGNDLSFNTNVTYGFRIRPISTRFTLSSVLNKSRSLTLINNVENTTNTTMNINTVRADITPGDNFNLGLSARVSFNNTNYSQNNQLNPNYVNQAYTADLNYIIPNVVSFTSALDYAVYSYATNPQVQRIPIWNAAVYKSILKGKKAEIRLSVNDILGKNLGISQSASANSFTETKTNALGRYAMLTFTYNLNGGVQQQSMGRGNR